MGGNEVEKLPELQDNKKIIGQICMSSCDHLTVMIQDWIEGF
jgi:hypothetical protein